VGYVSALDYERILAIVAEASRGTASEPLPVHALEMIRGLVGCDVASYCDGVPWDRINRRIWVTSMDVAWTDEEKAIAEHFRFDVPISPTPSTFDRAMRVTDVMPISRYRNLDLYQLAGRRHGIEYGMDYWMRGPGGHARGLRFDDSARDFSDRARDAVEVLGHHLRTVLGRFDLAPAPRTAAALTGREVEILSLVAEGRTNREIGLALAISPHTVRKHLENAYASIGAHSRGEAVVEAFGRTISREAKDPPLT
jgi:DNA-binding CsgD family transcriptional regulator